MSSKGVGWAIEQDVRGNEKLVLILMAEAHKVESGLAFPSVAWLVAHTGLDRKTVMRCVAALEAAGLIIDTGRRVGQTQQIKCFALNFERVPKTVPFDGKSTVFPTNSPKNGTRNQEDNNIPSRAKALSGSRAKPELQFEAAFPDDGSRHAFRVHCVQWAQEHMRWSAQDAGTEFVRFTDKAAAKGFTYRDWAAAWRSWCRSPYQQTKPATDEDKRPFVYTDGPLPTFTPGPVPPKIKLAGISE